MEEKKQIRIYHTHIEVYPYKLGENKYIEKLLSVWIDAEYRFDPIGFHVYNDVLYVPRGFNIYILQKEFNTRAFMNRMNDEYSMTRSYSMLFPPKNRIQEESIDFLTGEGEFKSASKYSQQALILDTGDGKTYATINSIIKLRMRAIIITHQDKIKMQWINTFIEKTNVPDNELCNISGSDVILDIMTGEFDNKSFYFVNHQTLQSYGKQHGWDTIHDLFKKMGIGIKVFDEAHLSFKNVLRVDFFTNTKKTFYLTANFDRSDPNEAKLFQRCFSSVYKFGEQTKFYEEKRRHIIYVPVLYRSNPSFNQLQSVITMHGFSVARFFKYAFHEDNEETMLKIFFDIFEIANQLEGRMLITLPTIEDTYKLKELMEKKYPKLGKTIGTINSKNKKYDNDNTKENDDIIISTIKSCGTGSDIVGLRSVINMEPFNSKITTNQLAGRLREYAKDKNTYFFDLIDIAFPSCEKQYKSKLPRLKKKCKEIQIYRK